MRSRCGRGSRIVEVAELGGGDEIARVCAKPSERELPTAHNLYNPFVMSDAIETYKSQSSVTLRYKYLQSIIQTSLLLVTSISESLG